MSSPTDFTPQGLTEYQARFGSAPAPGAEAERDRWIELCKQVLVERDRLRAQVEDLQRERSALFKALLERLPPLPPELEFDEDAALALVGKEPSVIDILDELEREFNSGAGQ